MLGNIQRQVIAGFPLVAVPDWTTTVVCLLDMRPGIWKKVQIRPFRVDNQGRDGDADVFQVSWGGQLILKQPRFCGKNTGVTA
jgi:hypothetical protein